MLTIIDGGDNDYHGFFVFRAIDPVKQKTGNGYLYLMSDDMVRKAKVFYKEDYSTAKEKTREMFVSWLNK